MNIYRLPNLAQTLFQQTGDIHLLFDPAMETIVGFNPAAQRLSGFTEHQLLRMTVSSLVRSESSEGMGPLLSAFHQGRLFPCQEGFSLRTAQDGVWISVNLTLCRLHAQSRVPALLTLRVTERKRLAERTAELTEANEALHAEIAERKRAEEAAIDLLQQLVTAQEEERHRIARELHDEMGQHLAAFMLGLKALRDQAEDRPAILRAVDNLEAIAGELGRRVRNLTVELRPAALDELGLETALRNLLETTAERSQLEVDFQCLGLEGGPLPHHLESCIYRIIQEALTNVLKHAEARCVSLVVERQNGQVIVIVEDDGRGFDSETLLRPSAEGRHVGLCGIKERIELLRGTLQIESAADAGTALFVRLPLPGSSKRRQP